MIKGYERAAREYEAKLADPYGSNGCDENCEECSNTDCCWWSEYNEEEDEEDD